MKLLRAAAPLASLASLALALASGLAGCASPEPEPGVIVRELAVGDLMTGGTTAFNLAFDDVDREILLLDWANGVTTIDENGNVLGRFDLNVIGPGFTSIAAIPGTDEILVTSPVLFIGYRVDLAAMTIVSEFCLEPVLEYEQHNFGLAYDEASDIIYVAPALWEGETIVGSSLQSYDGATGYLITSVDLAEASVDALDVDPATGRVALVIDGEIWSFAGDNAGALVPGRDLGRELGDATVGSFARDRVTAHHWVLDPSARVALEVD